MERWTEDYEESAIGNDAMYEEDNDEEEDTVDIGRQSHK